MAQTTGAEARDGYKIEVSTDATNWTDISGQSNTVTVDGGDQLIGEQNTADGQAPVVTGSNKVESSTVTVSCLYTETSGEAWRKVRDHYIGTDKTIAVRYSPRGGAQAGRTALCHCQRCQHSYRGSDHQLPTAGRRCVQRRSVALRVQRAPAAPV